MNATQLCDFFILKPDSLNQLLDLKRKDHTFQNFAVCA